MQKDEINILIVDDVNSMRFQLKDVLNLVGFTQVKTAGNGEEAKVMLAQSTFHLVLCDWHMEPTNGIELLKHIRNTPGLSNLTFVMVTAETTRELVIKAVTSGIDDYLVKPLTIQQVQNKVNAVLHKKKIL